MVIGVKPEFFSVHVSYIHERDAETNLTPLGKAFLAIGISCIRCPKMTKQQYASSIFLIFYKTKLSLPHPPITTKRPVAQ